MSSLVNASTPFPGKPTDGNGTFQIVHFDATVRRKEKMRQKSAAPQKGVAQAAVAPPMVAEPTAPVSSNGRGHQVAMPSPQNVSPQSAPPAAPPVPAPTPRMAASDNGSAGGGSAGGNGQAGSATPLSGKALEEFLVNFVVEQTGYPQEMVELDADLEADLGIDSIKKAQLFGELAEHFDVQAGDDLSLDDFPTLRHVMNFLAGVPQKDNSASASNVAAPTTPAAPVVAPVAPVSVQPAVAPAPVAPAPIASTPASANAGLSGADLEKFLVDFVVEQTGYPQEMIELDADLEADLGIDSIKKAQLFGELAEHFDVQAGDDLSLDDFPTLRHVMNFLDSVPQNSVPQNSVPQNSVPQNSVPQNGAASAAPTTPTQPTAAVVAPATPAVPAAPAVPPTAVAPVTPSPTPVASPPAPQPTSEQANGEDLESFLVNFVVEQTGYPSEMVELDADLEADLGIDSIKKAQLFGELAEHFEVQMNEDLSLDDFPTLRHVMNFLAEVPRKATV